MQIPFLSSSNFTKSLNNQKPLIQRHLLEIPNQLSHNENPIKPATNANNINLQQKSRLQHLTTEHHSNTDLNHNGLFLNNRTIQKENANTFQSLKPNLFKPSSTTTQNYPILQIQSEHSLNQRISNNNSPKSGNNF